MEEYILAFIETNEYNCVKPVPIVIVLYPDRDSTRNPRSLMSND